MRTSIRAIEFMAGLAIVLFIILWLLTGLIPFRIFEFWTSKGSVLDWLYAAWPIFAWAIGLNVLYRALTRNTPFENRLAEELFWLGAGQSILAGVLEEILFRWILFFTAIVGVQFFNFCFFGFIGFGIPKWIYLHIGGHIANFITIGWMKHILFHPAGWFVGAAMLGANASFRDGHKYQGRFGWANSWFIGMFLFWMLFEFGLLACILVHFLYDLFIEIVCYIDRILERRG